MASQETRSISNDEITKHHFKNLAKGTAVRNKDGSVSTVYTRQVDLLNQKGKKVPTLIPSVYDGKILNEEEAVERAVSSGLTYPTATTHEELREFDKRIHKDMKDTSAEEAASILGGLEPKMNKGGMTKQMEMFEDGGLSDEGGTIDEASGNDVPVGSLKEEVRDDIPAQLSEGEFVLPADVVRYHGLDKIMRLRDEAKAGLSRMEDMGQMGNSEEAVLPDDMPFNMEDLEMGEDSVSNDVPFNSDDLEMNVGGLVPQQQQPYGVVQPVAPQVTNTYTVPSAFTNTTQQPAVPVMPIVSPPIPAPTTPSFLLPQQTATAKPAQYSFKELMPGTVRREELNAAGQTGTPTVTPSTTTRTSTGGGSGTGSTATDLAGAAATAYTAYKVAPKVMAGAKSAYAALTGNAKAAKTGAEIVPYFKRAAGNTLKHPLKTVAETAATEGIKKKAIADATTKVLGKGMSGKAGVGINAQGIGYAAPTFVAAIALYSLFQGMAGMPSGKKNLAKYKEEVRDKRIKEVIVPYKQMMSGMAGVPYEQLLASQQPPKTPWQDMEDDIRASGVGDLDYELDNAKTMFQSNPVFQKQNEEFLAQGDNAKWFNPDMSRTDYMGELYENNPSLKSMAEASKNSFVAGTRLPTGAPNPVLVAQEQYSAHIEAGGEPSTFVPDFEPKETTTETAGT